MSFAPFFRLSMTLAACLASLAVARQAQADIVQVIYPPGWNMVGGPPGTDLSSAVLIETYGPSGYQPQTGWTAAGCQGVWAYFPAATPAAGSLYDISGSSRGSMATCPLRAGWNLIGNPLRSPAQLPEGVTAFWWDADHYQTLTTIPLGGAVWIESPASGSMVLLGT
jgi:hypothetical protein